MMSPVRPVEPMEPVNGTSVPDGTHKWFAVHSDISNLGQCKETPIENQVLHSF